MEEHTVVLGHLVKDNHHKSPLAERRVRGILANISRFGEYRAIKPTYRALIADARECLTGSAIEQDHKKQA